MTNPHILFIDDDDTSTQLIKIILEGEGYFVETASSGAEAMRKFRDNQFNIIFMDYKLPDSKGDELAINLQKISPNIKIILLTGMNGSNDDLAYSFNFDEVLLKPVPPEDIICIIKKI
jgi:CheY-like chemotaxis protein